VAIKRNEHRGRRGERGADPGSIEAVMALLPIPREHEIMLDANGAKEVAVARIKDRPSYYGMATAVSNNVTAAPAKCLEYDGVIAVFPA
jgi:hypothetical protein